MKECQKELQASVGTIAHSVVQLNNKLKQSHERKNKVEGAVFQAYEESREYRKSNEERTLDSFQTAVLSTQESNAGHLSVAIVHMKWNDRKREILSVQHKICTSLEINS